jgi:putative glycosyltransferase (TIGR04372 family)
MRRFAKRIFRKARARIRRPALWAMDLVLPLLSVRQALKLAMVAQALHLPGQRLLILNLIATTATGSRRSSLDASPTSRHRDVVRAIEELTSSGRGKAATVMMARALFELGEFRKAQQLLSTSGGEHGFDPATAHLRGLLALYDGNEGDADVALQTAVAGLPHLMAPEQNLAARSPPDYLPTSLDAATGRDGRLFNACNYLGQRTIHVGMGHLSTRIYARAFEAQKRLQGSAPPVSPACASFLDGLGLALPDIKVFGSEWTTQIGHQGLFDAALRMRDLGWWHGSPILLVNRSKVANLAFLSLFEHRARLLTLDASMPRDVGEELTSLQYYRGMSFNALEMPDGTIMQWSEAGALAMQQWDREQRPAPLRVAFDAGFAASEALASTLDQARRHWGMQPDDWYVCLHLRDGAFYREAKGAGQSHRNSDLDNYLAAIEYITGLGGFVIKLGGKASPKLPPMPRLVDYSTSAYKSDAMDIALMRHARLFIGTTSGLTNAAISLGVPAALVNCITTDAQLWHGQVRFAPKRILLEDGTTLSQAQITSCPWRWRMFDAAVLARYGAAPTDNTPDEILETVKEVMALAMDQAGEDSTGIEAAELYSRWRDKLSMPHFYGAARVSLYYLKKHRASLLADAEQTNRAS